jgi:outer membrane protein assembly factor BamD (BamD/ComL family)
VRLADTNPKSEKRDAARFMAGLAYLKMSLSYNNFSAVGTDPSPGYEDEAWRRAHDSFTRLTRSNSRSRFAPEARGWLAYLFLRVGRTGEGLAEYYRLLADSDGSQVMRHKALISLRMARPTASPADMEQLERILADEPNAARAYLYHNTYNHTFHTLFSYDDSYAYLKEMGRDGSAYDYQDNEKFVEQHRASLQQAELSRTARYASELMRRHPHTRLGGAFALRLAEINLELGEHAAALDFAERALLLNVSSDDRAESLWVKGVAESRLAKNSISPPCTCSVSSANSRSTASRRRTPSPRDGGGDAGDMARCA